MAKPNPHSTGTMRARTMSRGFMAGSGDYPRPASRPNARTAWLVGGFTRLAGRDYLGLRDDSAFPKIERPSGSQITHRLFSGKEKEAHSSRFPRRHRLIAEQRAGVPHLLDVLCLGARTAPARQDRLASATFGRRIEPQPCNEVRRLVLQRFGAWEFGLRH